MRDERPERSLISVVIPAFNEESNIQPFFEELRATIDRLPEVDWEIIFVDDGSSDTTVAKVIALHEVDQRVKAVQLSRNFGSHPALSAGLSYAGGDAAVVISADLQDPPALIEAFLEQWRQGYHIVWGIRETRDDPWTKTLLANTFYRICRAVALPNFPKGGMDCGLFDRKVIDVFLSIGERNGYVFANILWTGFRQAQVPYARRARYSGVGKWGLAKRIKAAIDIIVSFSYLPIRFISYLGIFISCMSFVYSSFLIVRRVWFGLGGSGWPSVMVAILFLGGVQLIMLGILGEYIWRASDQVRARPLYVVMDEIGFEKARQWESTREAFNPRLHRGPNRQTTSQTSGDDHQ
jgi:dolichol-phosphate mannosyltransferase